MAEMTPDQRKEMLSDPGFWDKPEKDQIAALSAASSKFKGAPPNVQLGTLQALHASIQHPGVNPKPATPPAPSKTPSIGTAIEKGMYEGPAQLDRFAANALGMMGLTRASEYYRKRQEASQAAASKLPESQTVGQSIAEAIPSMIGQIPALATRSPLGFAAVGAVQRADEGVGGALEGAAENYGMAKMFPVVGRAGEKILSKVPGVPSAAAKMLGRPLAVGAIPGFIDYISGKPLHQAIGDAATMAAISVFHGNSREAKESAKAAAASAEKVPQPQITEEIEGRPVEKQNPELVKRVQEARAKKGVPSAEPFVKPKTIEEAEQQLNSAIQRQVQMEEAGQDTSSLQKNIVRLQASLEDPELMADWSKRHPGTAPPKEASPKGQELIPTTPERKASRLAAAKDRAKTPVVVPGLGQRVAPEEVGEFPDQMKPKERLIRPPEEERNPKSSIPKGTVDTTKVQILKANGSEPGTLPFRDTPDNMVNKGWIRLIGDGKYITLKKLPGMPEGTRFRFGTIAPPPPTTPF